MSKLHRAPHLVLLTLLASVSVSCTPVRQETLAPWPAAESLYVRICDIPKTSDSLGKVVRVRGIYWSDGVGSHSGFYDPTCSQGGRYLDFYTSPDGDDSVVALTQAIRDPPCRPHYVCGVRLQIDVTGRLRTGFDLPLGIEITHVHFSKPVTVRNGI
jgi:hypothetical protein